MVNILYLVDTAEIIGGGEISLLNLLKHLDRSRFNPLVVVPREGGFAERLRQANVTVRVLDYKKIKNPFNLTHTIRMFKDLVTLVRQEKIALLHSNSTGGFSCLGSLAARRAGLPFIWHVRAMDSGGILDVIQGFCATRIILISKAERRRFWWLPLSKKFNLIYNGVDFEKFSAGMDPSSLKLRNEMGCVEGDLLVGTVGRYHPIKGLEYFVKAASLVLKKMPSAKFVIVGLAFEESNAYLKELRKTIKRLGLEDKVALKGPRTDIQDVFNSLDLFVMPSLNEPFGRVLIEAMACQKAVVSFSTGGIPEIVDEDTTGFLIRPKDIAGMAEKIVFLLQENKKREAFAANGRRRVLDQFGIKKHVKKVEALYGVLLEGGRE